MSGQYDRVDSALRYAGQVLNGDIVAGALLVAACRRFISDLEDSSRWRFNPDRAEKYIRMMERFPHTKGAEAGRPLALEPWQHFAFANVLGWECPETGKRRFRRVYIEVARGNGKSTMTAPLGLVCGFCEGEAGAEIYSAATTRDQARIIFDVAQRMAKMSPSFSTGAGVTNLAHSLYQESSGSYFRALSADGQTLDGLNSHLVLVDELHAHKTRAVYDVLETSIGKRSQSMIWSITTAGTNRRGICYEVRTHAEKVLTGQVQDDQLFALIYSPDNQEDWSNEAEWSKANPNLGTSVQVDVLRGLAAKAQTTPAAINNFKTKHLNIWCNANSALYSIDGWNSGRILTKADQKMMRGQACYLAIDLATRNDLCAYVLLFRDGDGYSVLPRFFLPETVAAQEENDHYAGWVRAGWINTTPGNSTNQMAVIESVRQDCEQYDVKQVAVDPWQSTMLLQVLQGEGLDADLLEFRQTLANFSEPTKELGGLIESRKISHDGNPVLSWCIGNVVGRYDAKENVYPRKDRSEDKIDGAIALVMALGMAIKDQLPPQRSWYEENKLLVI